MKRKLNESLGNVVKINCIDLVNDEPELKGRLDEIADDIEQDLGVVVTQEDGPDGPVMVIDGSDSEEVIELFDKNYYIDVTGYIIETDLTEGYEDYDDYDDLEGDDDAGSWEEYDGSEVDDMDDDMLDSDDDEDWEEDYPAWDEDDDVETMLDDVYSDAYESEEYDDEDSLNDCGEFDECVESIEDEEFECYESKKSPVSKKKALRESAKKRFGKRSRLVENANKKIAYKRLLNERKKSCCPPAKKGKMVSLTESLNPVDKSVTKTEKKVTVKDIISSAKNHVSINESVLKNATLKALKESSEAIKSPARNKSMREDLRKLVGSAKYDMIAKAVSERQTTLYKNKKINGANISKISSKELYHILEKVKVQCDKLTKSYNSLNESGVNNSTKKEIRDALMNKERLMDVIDEELTYRLIFRDMMKKKLNEEEENPLEPLSVDPSEGDEKADDAAEEPTEDTEDGAEDTNPDEDEEVELSRVVITVANQEAADELKQAMVDAGIPEDVIEFETEEEESGEDSEETEEGSESEEEGDKEAEGEDKESNESLHVNKFKRLLEDEEAEGDDAEASEDDTESDTEEGDEDTETEETEEGAVKVVLTNTDYVNDLADVLNNEYGITKEEFEEMIGGEIVDNEESDDDSEEGDEDKDSDKEDEDSSNGDDAVDQMTQEEIDKLFGGN